jgi:hypothetical protein
MILGWYIAANLNNKFEPSNQSLIISWDVRMSIQKFPDWVDNEINNNNKHSLRSNTKSCGGKTNWTDSQNSDTTAPSGRELHHLQFSL